MRIGILIILSGFLLAACSQSPAADAPTPVPTAAEAAATTAPASTPEPTAVPDPPPVPNASLASEYSGTTISFYGDSVGLGVTVQQVLADQFRAATGIAVEVLPRPRDATENYAAYESLFASESPEVDVLMLDVVWPAAFAPHLVDLNPALGEAATEHFAGIIENNTVDERLIAMPWFANIGLLYYRTDLLEQYGYAEPPATWDELETMATTIQAGERSGGNANFVGFVWQGAAYEGTTCTGLEFVASHGGGMIIEDGAVTINNPQAIAALDRARGWVGSISPDNITSFREEDARTVFQNGNALFMRNWPYAYAAASEPASPIRDKFAVAPLPSEPGEDSFGTVGGWQLAVSAYSENQAAAIEFVRYMTSPEVQAWRARVGSYVPTIPAIADDPEVLAVMPFLEDVQDVVRVARPSRETGSAYNAASTVFFEGVHAILEGAEASRVLPAVEADLTSIIESLE